MAGMVRAGAVLAAVLLLAGPLSAQESQAAKTSRAKLKQKISVDLKEVGTKAVFDEIKGEMDKPVNFKIDNVSGISNNTKLSYKGKDVTVEQVLNDLSDKYDFGWIVVSNAANNKIDGWVIIRKTLKGKERGYEAGKEPAKEEKKGAFLEQRRLRDFEHASLSVARLPLNLAAVMAYVTKE